MIPRLHLSTHRLALGWLLLLITIGFASWSTFVQSDDLSVIGEGTLSLEAELPIAALVAQADVIVRGRISTTVSDWNADETAISTVSTLETTYPISGSPDDVLTILTDGGFVEGDIGMKSSNSPIFTVGEEVVLFLNQQESASGDTVYKVTRGDLGTYIVTGKHLANTILRSIQPTEAIYNQIDQALLANDKVSQTPADWESYENDAPPLVFDGYDGQGFVYKNRKWGGTCPEVKYKINVNTAQAGGENGSVEEFRDGIISAANSWNAVGTSDFLLTYDGETDAVTTGFNGSNEIIFSSEGLDSPTGLARFWFTADFVIVEADIWFNDDFTWDATGDPKFTEVDLESVALHEFGHWLALGHDDSSDAIMFPTLTMGTTKRALHQNEEDGISFIYPRGADSTCAQAILPTETPTAIPPTAIPPTATPTPVNTESEIQANFSDGAPGSYFTIFGMNQGPSDSISLTINGTPATEINVSPGSEFAVILDSSNAELGTYIIGASASSQSSNLTMLDQLVQSVVGAVSGASATNETSVTFNEVAIQLVPDAAQRVKEVPLRSDTLSIVELSLATNNDSQFLFLPFIQR